jgi:hypothetical protein
MINSNYNLMGNPTSIAIESINNAKVKMNEAAQKVAEGDVNVVEQVLQNERYSQQVQAASKIIEAEQKTIGSIIDTVA